MSHSLFLCCLLFILPAFQTLAADNPWQAEFDKFADDDAARGADPVDIVFVGSSSIRLWDLGKSFPSIEPTPLNRGFGGSQFADVAANLDLLVIKHKPRVVVLYSGDNDIASGKSPEEVHAAFVRVVEGLRAKLPETKLVVIATKPSIARWKLRDAMRELNTKNAATCSQDPLCTFVDVWHVMLSANGEPRPELFVEDGLHLNTTGYAEWAKLVLPLLEVGGGQ